jgi:hypothetical protein
MRTALTRLAASKLLHLLALALLGAVWGISPSDAPPEPLRIDRSEGFVGLEEWAGETWSWRHRGDFVKVQNDGRRHPGCESDLDCAKAQGLDLATVSDKPLAGVWVCDSTGAGGCGGGKYGCGIVRWERTGARPADSASALHRSLGWLERHQDALGMWDPASSCPGCGVEPPPVWGDEVESTALCVLAFLAAGHDHASPRFGDTVRRGLEFLLFLQEPSGRVGSTAGSHALASTALRLAARRTGAPILVDAGRRARRWQNAQPGRCAFGSWDPAWRPGWSRAAATAAGAIELARHFEGS